MKRIVIAWVLAFFSFSILSLLCAAAETDAFKPLIGKWKRNVGWYWADLDITKIKDDGGASVQYYGGRRFVHISRAEVKMYKSRPRIYVEFQDKDYPGSFYDLIYEVGELRGIYYYALEERTLFAKFIPREPSVEFQQIDGILLPKDIKVISPVETIPRDIRFYSGWWKGILDKDPIIIVVEEIDSQGRVKAIYGWKTGSYTDFLRMEGKTEDGAITFEYGLPERRITIKKEGEGIYMTYTREPYARGKAFMQGFNISTKMERFDVR